MALLTPTERITLEMIRDNGVAPWAAVARAIDKGWVAKQGAGRGKGIAGKEARYSLTEAGLEALKSDADQRMEMRAANRPRRR
jgi:hypothetical protein